MSSLDFDATDYIDDISTENLARELERRKHPVKDQYQLRDVTETLVEAWNLKDRLLFDKALLQLEPPEIAERRACRIREKYQTAMSEKRTTH